VPIAAIFGLVAQGENGKDVLVHRRILRKIIHNRNFIVPRIIGQRWHIGVKTAIVFRHVAKKKISAAGFPRDGLCESAI